MRRKYNKPLKSFRVIFNDYIIGETFRVLDEKNKQIGVLSRQDTFAKAKELNTDVVLIAKNAKPPVVKLIDINKYKYQIEKKQKAGLKGQKKSQTKDITISLFIGENDLNRMIQKAKDFLHEGYQVRIKLPLRGRENIKKDKAFQLINFYISKIDDINVTTPPKLQGKLLSAVITRKK